MPATFTKGERLSSFKEIQLLMKEGKVFFHYPFKAIYRFPEKEEGNNNAIIVSVPKRHFKRAVKRNLLKRRMRESYRLNKSLLTAPHECVAHVLFVYIAKEIMEYGTIEKRMTEIMQHISHQCEEKGENRDETV